MFPVFGCPVLQIPTIEYYLILYFILKDLSPFFTLAGDKKKYILSKDGF
jgi:hypothetical protein